MEQRGKCKAGKRPYMKLFTSDYRDGTAQLSFEVQGFYFRILTYLNDGESVPADAADLARFLQCNARTVRKLLPKLIAAGKLYQAGFELKNPRIERELEANSTPSQPEFEPKSEPKIQKHESNQEGSEPYYGESHFHCHIHSQKEEQAAPPEQEPARTPPSLAALPGSLDELHSRLVEACNGSLDNPVNCLGLLSMATPQMWLERGADFERDVIPTLEAAGKKYHGKRIRDWSYFTGMVADAVEKRRAPMKPGKAAPPRETDRERRARIFEKLEREGRI